MTKCTAPSLSVSVNTSNRITNSGFTYNASGDMTADGIGGLSFTWNAEERLTAAGGVTYTYDGDGWRVKKSNGIIHWRSLSGEILAETDLSGNNLREYIYFAGRRVARRDNNGTISYFLQDHLGSTRIITSSSGSVVRDSDYYAHGTEKLVSGTVDDPHKFAGMYLDSESGLYYTWFRMYSPSLGRWLAPDPIAGDVETPGSLNRYGYVLNNPVNLVDPLGLSDCQTSRSAEACRDQNKPGVTTRSGSPYGDIGNCYLDGALVPCGMVHNWWSGGLTVQCPNNVCSAWGEDGNGKIAFVRFEAHASGWQGYVAISPWIPDPSLPGSQIHDAFLLLCKYSTLDCSGSVEVNVRLKGGTYNVGVDGATATGVGFPKTLPNPLTIEHEKPSFYTWSPIWPGHVVPTQTGVEAHHDNFNPWFCVICHTGEWVAGKITGEKTSTWTCSVAEGCSPQ